MFSHQSINPLFLPPCPLGNSLRHPPRDALRLVAAQFLKGATTGNRWLLQQTLKANAVAAATAQTSKHRSAQRSVRNPGGDRGTRVSGRGANRRTCERERALASGHYSFIASSGNVSVKVKNGFVLGGNAPQNYILEFTLPSVTTNTALDIKLPAKRVTFHVQDQTGNAIAGAGIQTARGPCSNFLVEKCNGGYINNGNLSLGGGIYASGGSDSLGVATNAQGDAVLWLFSEYNSSVGSYAFEVTPPTIYTNVRVTDVSVVGDLTQVISLQYSHNPPITTINLSPELNAANSYADPTTVTLTASAAGGYTVATTYYKIDIGAVQTYTAPFTVSGGGDHRVDYWSVDNSGVQESHKTKIFTIQTNHDPVLEPIGNKSVGEGQPLQFTLVATDQDNDNLTFSVANLPAGATFNSQTAIFSWTPTFDQEGNYDNIEFTITDDGSPIGLDTDLITITVGNVNRAPIFEQIGSQEVLENQELTFTVNATDPTGRG